MSHYIFVMFEMRERKNIFFYTLSLSIFFHEMNNGWHGMYKGSSSQNKKRRKKWVTH